MNQQLVDGTKHQVEGRPLQGNSWWILQWVQNIWWMNQLVGTTHTKHWLDATNQETKNKLCLLCIAYFTFTTTMHLINARKLWPRSKKKKYMIYIYICLFNIYIYICLNLCYLIASFQAHCCAFCHFSFCCLQVSPVSPGFHLHALNDVPAVAHILFLLAVALTSLLCHPAAPKPWPNNCKI